MFKQNYNTSLGINNTFRGKHQINFFKPNSSNPLTAAWILNQTHSSLQLDEIRFSFTKKFVYANLLDKLNNDNDKKKVKKLSKKTSTLHP